MFKNAYSASTRTTVRPALRAPLRTASALALVVGLTLTGCSAPSPQPAASASGAGSETSSAEQSASITITDAWIKAGDSGMTGAFGVLKNSGTQAATLIAVRSDAAEMVELHETTANEQGEMTMSQKEGGFTIEPGGTLLLEPGANHIMLMGLTGPIRAGAEIAFTLVFADGSTRELIAPAKDYAGANENYSGESGSEHGDGEHDSSEHGSHGTSTTEPTP